MCERGGRSKDLAFKASYLQLSTAVTKTHVTHVTRDDRKVRVTTITTRELRPQWECYLTKQTRRVGRKWPWEWREPRSTSMYSSPSRRFRSLISYADHPRRWLTRRALSYSSLTADCLWLAIAKAVGCCPIRLKLFDVAKVRVDGIKQLQSFERRREWRDMTRDKINCWYRISHAYFTGTPTPSVYVSLSHDLQWGSLPAYGLSDRREWPDGAADCCLPSIWHDY